ncbi:MAG: hypothetical protein HJJLKODD_00027 [Phycisphaerae bacterium]|nr:hypothetical protein [Phycisphaerae bacterium]
MHRLVGILTVIILICGCSTAPDSDSSPSSPDQPGDHFIATPASNQNSGNIKPPPSDLSDEDEFTTEQYQPIADAGSDQEAVSGSLILLDGSASYEIQGYPLMYQWRQLSGVHVALIGSKTSQVRFTAPTVDIETSLLFELQVDCQSATTIDQVQVIIHPVLNSGAGNSVDQDNESAPSAGEVDSGNSNIPAAGGTGSGNSGSGSGSSGVGNSGGSANNTAIIVQANAGADQQIHSGDMVTLNGSASNATPSGPLIYQWQQIGGPPVTINNAQSVQAQVPSPIVTAVTVLLFDLAVSSGAVIQHDAVEITVLPSEGHGLEYLLYYGMRPHTGQKFELDDHVDELMSMGFTHVVLQDVFSSNPQWIQEFRDHGYPIAMYVNTAAHVGDLGDGNDPDKYHLVSQAQFPNFPGCPNNVNPASCPVNASAALCPGYGGPLWQDMLDNIRTSTALIQPEVVIIDAEYFSQYSTVEIYLFPGVINACSRCGGASGYEENRRQRGRDLVQAVKDVAPDSLVMLHHTNFPSGKSYCFHGGNDSGNPIIVGASNWWPEGVSDIPVPEQYGYPSLELMTCNAQQVMVDGAIPAISFHYGPWEDDGRYNPQLSYQVGQLYKAASVRGLIIYESWFPNFIYGDDWAYWRDHAQALINGLSSIP